MLTRIAGALLRAFLMVLLVATPSAMLPGTPSDTTQIVALVAVLVAFLTFIEYYADCPSFVEFSTAAPYNRVRYLVALTTVFILAVMCRGKVEPSTITMFFTAIGQGLSALIDFPYSPVRLMVLMMPDDTEAATVNAVRTAAGIAYIVSICGLAVMVLLVRVWHWPRQTGGLNLWTNLPNFDPASGKDIVQTLSRDGQLNIILGFLLPFLIPAGISLISRLVNPVDMSDPHIMIWTVTAWAFLPASLIMRGIALSRIADMIKSQRARAASTGIGLQPA